MKNILTICLFVIMFLAVGTAEANTVASSTMHFKGTLTPQGGNVYTGTIDMTVGEYYVTGGPGESISTSGGFDVYAKEGGTSYISVLPTPHTYTIGSDHDGYPKIGTPWGTCDPDVGDWDYYSLELTSDHWYLRYTEDSGFVATPMSGAMNWSSMYAAETDAGTSTGNNTPAPGGGPGTWDCNWGWLTESIPLQYAGFAVSLSPTGTPNEFDVSLTPVPVPGAVLLGLLGLSVAGVKLRKYA